ncbi:7861_t:CDS:2 [Acaulospora morrowiae]|uniref:7861_t:CDS:1 n=1 Tax=Acaulospora morrowiae TaxID=94023 RepID=A0A9N8VD92_9GLOM|nr:7861_t:CDS:2 [Acaulospora morrowiae]
MLCLKCLQHFKKFYTIIAQLALHIVAIETDIYYTVELDHHPSITPEIMAKHAILPPLTIDCLEEILNNLLDNKGSLYSCALVNRTWSRLAIPLIWYNPFFDKLSKSQIKTIFELYSSCMPEELIHVRVGKKYFPKKTKKPLFDYVKCLRGIDWSNFLSAICSWIDTFYPTDRERTNFFDHFIGSLLTRCNGLRVLTLKDEVDEEYMHYLINYTNFHLLFSKLETFEIQFNLDMRRHVYIPHLLSQLSSCSHKIQHMKLHIGAHIPLETYEACWNLIGVQRNLKNLQIWNYEETDLFYSRLATQSRSLTSLNINADLELRTLLPFLMNCKNLETLELWKIPVVDMESLLCFSNSSTNLPIRRIICHGWAQDIEDVTISMSMLICMTNHNLREFYLYKESVTQKLLDVICQNCPNLTDLYLSFNALSLENVSCLSRLPLRSLGMVNRDAKSYSIELLRQIASSLPSTIDDLEVNFGCTSQGLQYFLANFGGKMRKFTFGRTGIGDQYLEVIIHYAKTKKSLQEFRYPQMAFNFKPRA